MKRFTETGKWSDPWYRKLKPNIKLFWQFMLDSCDHAGIWSPDIEMAEFQIGVKLPAPADLLKMLDGRVATLDNGKWFVRRFIEFQQRTDSLNPDNKAHLNIIRSLRANGIEGAWKDLARTLEGASEGLGSPPGIVIVKSSTGEEESEEEATPAEQPEKPADRFEEFWELVPNKIGKGKAREKWLIAIRNAEPDVIIAGVASFTRYEADRKRRDPAGYQPLHPATWLHQERWHDDLPGTNKKPDAPKVPQVDPEGWVEWLHQQYPGHEHAEYHKVPESVRAEFRRSK